jgi:hypothetical protein
MNNEIINNFNNENILDNLNENINENFDNNFDNQFHIDNIKISKSSKKIKNIKNFNKLIINKNFNNRQDVGANTYEENYFKKIVDDNKGGYNAYFKNRELLGNTSDILNQDLNKEIENNFKINVLQKLEDGKTYSLLLFIVYIDDGVKKGASPMKSIIISNKINTHLVLQRIKMAVAQFESSYQLNNYWGQCFGCWREWLNKDDYLKGITDSQVDNIVNEVLKEEMPYSDIIKKRGLDKLINFNNFDNIITKFPNFRSVEELPNINKMSNNNLPLEDLILYKDINNFIVNFNLSNAYYNIFNVYLFNENNINYLLFVFQDLNSKKNRIICQSDYESWNTVIEHWNSNKYPYTRWIDSVISERDNKFSRLIGDYKIYFSNDKIDYIDRLYNFPNLRINPIDNKYNDKIGTLDLETFSIDNNRDESNLEGKNLGVQEVYAGGWALNNIGSKTFIIDNINIHNGNDIIKVMFEELFLNNIKGYTLYAHNLGRFDSIFLIKELATLNYIIKPIWKDNRILKIKIIDCKSNQSIILLDSINLVNCSLNKFLISFDCKINKGMFPHSFVNPNNLNYIGDKPDKKYFDLTELSQKYYDDLPEKWNLKEECLNYLNKDILGLLEAMNKMSNYYYDEYKINITKYMTLPSLAMGVFGYNFYNEDFNIKMIKGPLEKFIREAYFGGNISCYTKSLNIKNSLIKNAYHYDMNSQYPKAMLNKMPTGNPVFSTNTNLSYYFGFVYAHITPPPREKLKNLYIQFRTEEGKISCPRTPFYRWIPSFELEHAIKDNYKADIICGINFPDALKIDSENLFKKYVECFFEKKKNAKDKIEKNIAKLMLNSLYGKFGQKDIDSKIRLLPRSEADKIVKKYHYSYFAEINEDVVLIKYSSKLNEKLRRIYTDEDDIDDNLSSFSKERGVVSAVQISCAIAAYARMSINPFKNNKEVILYYSDTDSLVLSKELNENIVGNGLGEWKLEGEIKKGIFIRPKLYTYYKIDGSLKKVASGVDSNKLTFEDYVNMGKGKSVVTNNFKMSVNWSKLEIKTFNQKIILTP